MSKYFESYVGYERIDESYKDNYSKERYLDAIASLFHIQAPVTACVKQDNNLYISYNKSPQPIHETRKECIKSFLLNIKNYDKDSLLLMYLIFNEDFAFAQTNSNSDLDLFIKQCSKDDGNSNLIELSQNLKQLSKFYRNKVDKLLVDIFKFVGYAEVNINTIAQDIINGILTKNNDIQNQWIEKLLVNFENKIIDKKNQLNQKLETLKKEINLCKEKENYELLEKLNAELKNHPASIELHNISTQEKLLKSLKDSIKDIQKGECNQIIIIYKSIIENLNIHTPKMEKYNLESILRPMQDCYKLYLKYQTDAIDILDIIILDNSKDLHADTNIAITMRLGNKDHTYIGVSKLTCGYCHKELSDYPHRGTHGVCDDGWNYYLPTQEKLGLKEFSQNEIKLQKVPKIKNFELVNQRKDLSFDNSYDNNISKDDINYKTLLDLKNKHILKKDDFYSNLGKNFKKLGLYKDQYSLKGIDSKEIPVNYIDPYFGKYTIGALVNILQLRISELDKYSDIKIFQGLFINRHLNNITEVIKEVSGSDKNTVLLPINLFNKHAVGLIFERITDNSYQIKYIDPMNKSIPQELLQIIQDILPNSYYEQITVEQQKYANCGPEVIENFILSLTGNRASQEKAIELHSKLVENSLLDLPVSNTHLLFEQPDYYGYQPDICLSGNYDQETC